MSYRSTARFPVRCSGVTRPICQSQRIGCPFAARCGGYQHCGPPPADGRHATGRGIGTTCQLNRATEEPAAFDVRTATRCGPGFSPAAYRVRPAGSARHGPPSTR